MDLALIIISSIALGLFVGVFSGMLGIGGGTIFVPAFRLLFGLSPLESTATSLFTIIPTSLSGAFSHVRHKTAYVSLGLVLGIAGACTSPIGVLLAGISPGWVVMVVAALVIGYSAVSMLLKAVRMGSGKSDTQKKKSGGKLAEEGKPETVISQEPEEASVRLNFRTVSIGIVIGLVAGLISGYIGVGGGFIMVPLMVIFFGMPLKKVSGTSLVAIIILAIPAVIQQGLQGNVDYLVGLIVAIGSIPGAVIGAKFVRRVSERTLRFIFGGFLIVAAVLLALNEFHVLG